MSLRTKFNIFLLVVFLIMGTAGLYFLPKLQLKNQPLETVLVVFSGFFLIFSVINLFFNRFILRPLRIIRKATQPISKGVFSGYIKDIKQKDELGELAEDFNKMIRGLNSLTGEIGRLKEIGRIKSEFISITAHQLRTPLSGIKWVLELSLEKESNKEIRGWLLKIHELNERMIEIISDLLNAARIEEGRFGFEFQERVDLLTFLDKIIESYKIEIEEKRLDFSFSKKGFKNLYLRADPEKLEIALDNIIENAIEYTKEGGSVKIELEKPNGFVIIKIQDTGIGIAKKDLPRLFSKFFRAKNAISIQPSGSGIGLFIARNIIESHQGELWLESKLNKGTAFYIKLPLVDFKKKEFEEFFKKI